MRMESVSDTGGEVGVWHRRAQPGHIEIGLVEIAPEFAQDCRKHFLAAGVVDKPRFERSQDSDAFRYRKCLMNASRVAELECGFEQFSGKCAQAQSGFGWRVHEDVARIESRAPFIVVDPCIDVNCTHSSSSEIFSLIMASNIRLRE